MAGGAGTEQAWAASRPFMAHTRRAVRRVRTLLRESRPPFAHSRSQATSSPPDQATGRAAPIRPEGRERPIRVPPWGRRCNPLLESALRHVRLPAR